MSLKYINYTFLVLAFAVISSQNAIAQCEKSDFDCWINTSVELLRLGDTNKANDLRKKAKKARNSNQQKEAYNVFRSRMTKYYSKYWKALEQGNNSLQQNNFVAAFEGFEESKSLAQACLIQAFPMTKELDKYLLENVDTIIAKARQTKNKLIEEHLEKADQYVLKEYLQKALNHYKSAMDLEDDVMARADIQSKFMETKHTMHMKQGQDYMIAKKASNALSEFKEAKKIKNDGEVDRKIVEAENLYFKQKIEESRSFSKNKQFEEAQKALDQAASIRKDSDYHQTRGLVYSTARDHYLAGIKKGIVDGDYKSARTALEQYNIFKESKNKGNVLIEEQINNLTNAAESSLKGESNNSLEDAISKYQNLYDLTGNKKYEQRVAISKRIKELVNTEKSNFATAASISNHYNNWVELVNDAHSIGMNQEEFDFTSKKAKAYSAKQIVFKIITSGSNQLEAKKEAQNFPYRYSTYINSFKRYSGKIRIKITELSQSFGPVHDRDCTRMQGEVLYKIFSKGVEVKGDNYDNQTIVNYQGTKSKDYPFRDFNAYQLKSVTFIVDEEALDKGKVSMETHFKLKGCHKGGWGQSDYNCSYNYNNIDTDVLSNTKNIITTAASSSKGHTFKVSYKIEQFKY